MKKTILIILALFLIATPVFAQTTDDQAIRDLLTRLIQKLYERVAELQIQLAALQAQEATSTTPISYQITTTTPNTFGSQVFGSSIAIPAALKLETPFNLSIKQEPFTDNDKTQYSRIILVTDRNAYIDKIEIKGIDYVNMAAPVLTIMANGRFYSFIQTKGNCDDYPKSPCYFEYKINQDRSNIVSLTDYTNYYIQSPSNLPITYIKVEDTQGNIQEWNK